MSIDCIKQVLKVEQVKSRCEGRRCANPESQSSGSSATCRARRETTRHHARSIEATSNEATIHGESSDLRAGYQPRWCRSSDDVPSPVLSCSLSHMLKHASPGSLTSGDDHRYPDVLWRMRHVAHSREFSACLPMRTMTADRTTPTTAGSE